MAGEWNEAEFAFVFREHYRPILRVARRVVGSTDAAEEVCADTFWRLYRAGPKTIEQGAVAGWLYRTATRAAIDVLRAHKRRGEAQAPALLDAEDHSDGPLTAVIRGEQVHAVRRVLAQLDAQKAQILLLRHSGLSYAEIAHAMNVRPNSVGTMLARAEQEFCVLYQRQTQSERNIAPLKAAKEQP